MSRPLAALAGCAGVLLLASITHGASPLGEPPAADKQVTAVVRNDLGQLKWVVTEATDYTPLEAEGRRVYIKGGCNYCHSQYVRPVSTDARPWGPVTADVRRWGPLAEPGESAYDKPRLFGPGGVGPDLSREGLKYGDEWHLAHFWNPPGITRGSIMGGFSGLFQTLAEPVTIVDDAAFTLPDGSTGKTLDRTAATEGLFDFDSKDQVKLTPNKDGLLFVPMDARGKHPIVWTPNAEFTGEAVKLVAETREIQALTAYIQKLGTDRGQWRDLAMAAEVEGSEVTLERSDDWIARGKLVYERRCIACHGETGNGNGWASTFMSKQRPRNFTTGVFKFRLTKGTLPSDADLLRTITRGVRGTAMPAWYELPLDERLAVMQYVKYALTVDRSDETQSPSYYFVDEPPGPPMSVGTPPKPSTEMIARGKTIWQQAKCWECHGQQGRGDGQKAPGLKDDWGFPIHPANLTRGQFKSGPTVSDLYRTITTGLSGTPMASFKDAFPDADRWALSYYVLSLSAFTDPLSGKSLPLSPADRAALNDPNLQTLGPEHAYRPRAAPRLRDERRPEAVAGR